MAILTAQEAAEVLDYESVEDMPGKVMSIFVPAIDSFLEVATGKNWGEDEEIAPLAKVTASVLLVRWFADPGQVGKVSDRSLVILINQLKALGGK